MKTIEEQVREFNEFGWLHSEHCACVQENPDECDCGMKKASVWLKQALLTAEERGGRKACEAILEELMDGMTQEQAITAIKQTLALTNPKK